MKLKSEFLFALLLMPLVAGADSSTPCMDALKKFTAPEVPALGPAETEVTPGRWGTNTMPAGLPERGAGRAEKIYCAGGSGARSRRDGSDAGKMGHQHHARRLARQRAGAASDALPRRGLQQNVSRQQWQNHLDLHRFSRSE